MEEIHAHEVLHMMEGKSYTEASLRAEIIAQFGKDQHFYACTANSMDVDDLLVFLKQKGKFTDTAEGFTVDINSVCDH